MEDILDEMKCWYSYTKIALNTSNSEQFSYTYNTFYEFINDIIGNLIFVSIGQETTNGRTMLDYEETVRTYL